MALTNVRKFLERLDQVAHGSYRLAELKRTVPSTGSAP
jgi:hypothetical protein